jgi:hypothetical protein
MKILSVVILVLLIAGCASRGPERTSEENPTVTYTYGSGELEEAKQNAAKYCYDNYRRSALFVKDVQSGDKRVMSVECVITAK